MVGMQVEDNTQATPVVFGSRGTTVATGGGWADRTINANHGELVNGPTYSSTNNGYLIFDGVNDYIEGTNSSNYSTNSITLSSWVKIISVPTSDFTQIIGGSGCEGAIYVSTNTSTIFGQLTFSNVGNTQTGNYTLNLNLWYHVSLTWSSGDRMRLYVNGSQVATSSGTISETINIIKYRIARYNCGTYLNCHIAIPQIYNRALSASEVLQNYNAQKSRFGLP
jgi:hypothetical protein